MPSVKQVLDKYGHNEKGIKKLEKILTRSIHTQEIKSILDRYDGEMTLMIEEICPIHYTVGYSIIFTFNNEYAFTIYSTENAELNGDAFTSFRKVVAPDVLFALKQLIVEEEPAYK